MTSTRRGPAARLCSRARVVAGAQDEHPVERGLGLVRPRPGPHTGRDQQPVVRHLVAVGEPHPPGRHVQAGGARPRAATPHPIPAPGKRGAVGGRLPQQDLLGQRRPVVRLVRLVADQRQRPGEALLAQRLRGPQTGQRRADDDDPALASRTVPAGAHRPWAPPRGEHGQPGPSRPSTRIAWTGHAATARATCSFCSASACGLYSSRLVAVHGEDVGCEERALRVPLAAVEIDDKPHQRVPFPWFRAQLAAVVRLSRAQRARSVMGPPTAGIGVMARGSVRRAGDADWPRGCAG